MFSILFFPAQKVLPDGVLTENPLPASFFSVRPGVGSFTI
jgi:hypothetical protein